MTRLSISLAEVPSEVRCAKPSCPVASHSRLQRHHKGHQRMWFGIWASRRKGEKRWQAFVARYNRFDPRDVVLICENHHAEIHSIYDKIIANDRAAQTNIPLSQYNWTQAIRLMAKLTAACGKWLQKETPGIDSASFGETRKVYQSMLKKNACRAQRRGHCA